MPELTGLPLEIHIDTILSQFKQKSSIYGYPYRKIYKGFSDLDLSVSINGKTAATPLGPAAGPHTQLAQNIILSYLAGSRIVELKTIQILDELKIARPCIDIRNIGFNIEWSQELSLHNSYQEYLNAWIILHLIREIELLDIPASDSFYDFIFDMSVGYDLQGISSKKVNTWLNNMMHAGPQIEKQLKKLSAKYNHLKRINIPEQISDSVTLSTFHGCPSKEIEEIVKYLIKEHNLNVVIKMNPTLLGYEDVYNLLVKELGYQKLELDKTAFDKDLSFDQTIEIISRLQKFAKSYNRSIGAKFTNTLIVKNTENIFDAADRYLSGPPLYVLAMHTLLRFRAMVGNDFPISFSGGINKFNFSDAIACNIAPVTSCTDILKKGGYSRLYTYLENLKSEMEKYNSLNINQFILNRAKADGTQQQNSAGYINTKDIVAGLASNQRYRWSKNTTVPKKMNSNLQLFDCISCNICIPVCPNAANFSFKTSIGSESIINYKYDKGKFHPIPKGEFNLYKDTQFANIAEFCNDCGNCETFCPEVGAPYKIKPRFFLFENTFNEYINLDGFFFSSPDNLHARINHKSYQFQWSEESDTYIWKSERVNFHFDHNLNILDSYINSQLSDGEIVIMKDFYIIKTIFNAFRNHPENFPIKIF